MNSNGKHKESEHWLVRKETISWFWKIGLTGLIILTFLDLLIHKHPHFTIDGTFGFGSWYGFVSCAVLIFLAKGIGVFLKKSDTYYDD